MTIESYVETEEDRKIYTKIENNLRDSLTKLSSSRNIFDKIDYCFKVRISKMMGIEDYTIKKDPRP